MRIPRVGPGGGPWHDIAVRCKNLAPHRVKISATCVGNDPASLHEMRAAAVFVHESRPSDRLVAQFFATALSMAKIRAHADAHAAFDRVGNDSGVTTETYHYLYNHHVCIWYRGCDRFGAKATPLAQVRDPSKTRR